MLIYLVLATNFRYLNESLVKLTNFYLLGLVSAIIRVSIRTKSWEIVTYASINHFKQAISWGFYAQINSYISEI